jgi:hypothetical protein
MRRTDASSVARYWPMQRDKDRDEARNWRLEAAHAQIPLTECVEAARGQGRPGRKHRHHLIGDPVIVRVTTVVEDQLYSTKEHDADQYRKKPETAISANSPPEQDMVV